LEIFLAEARKLALIVHSGTLDKLLGALILASTAVALGFEVHLYFTFWGLMMLKKGEMEKAGLPATHRHMEEQLREKLKAMNYPTPYEMIRRLKASGRARLYACTPTMEMFGIAREDLIPEVDTLAGAATFFDVAADAAVTLFI